MKSKIIFLPVPQILREYISREEENDFKIDPNIPIPILLEDGNEEESLNTINIDTIILSMLHVIEEAKVEKNWLDYYSRFVLFLRPDILKKLEKLIG